MTEHADQPIRDAATAMLVRNGAHGIEVLMVRRAADQAFAAGAYVFPGGRVDADDAQIPVSGRDADAAERLVDSEIGLGFWGAAARETFEESGVLIATDATGVVPNVGSDLPRRVHAGEVDFGDLLRSLGASVSADRIAYVARWITPEGQPRRFDTRFFVLEAPPDVEATHDARETTEAVWVRPADLLDRGASGEASLLPPTMANLNWLACFDDVDAALEAGFTRSVDVVAPRVVSGADGSIVLELGNDESLVLRKGSRD